MNQQQINCAALILWYKSILTVVQCVVQYNGGGGVPQYSSSALAGRQCRATAERKLCAIELGSLLL